MMPDRRAKIPFFLPFMSNNDIGHFYKPQKISLFISKMGDNSIHIIGNIY